MRENLKSKALDERGSVLSKAEEDAKATVENVRTDIAAEVEKWQVPGLTVDSNYQLTVEDAEAVARHDTAIFADASVYRDTVYRHYANQLERGWYAPNTGCIDWLLSMCPYRRPEDEAHYVEGLRKAGIT